MGETGEPGTQVDVDVRLRASPQEARAFLSRLATDDAFRLEVEQNPAVLEQFGLAVPQHLVPEKIVLPPRWMIEDLLSRIDDPFAPGGGRAPVGFMIYVMVVAWAGPAPASQDAAGPPGG